MSINIGIIDAQATKLATNLTTEYQTRLKIKSEPMKQRSLAFVFLIVKRLLDFLGGDALDLLTESGNGLAVVCRGDLLERLPQ